MTMNQIPRMDCQHCLYLGIVEVMVKLEAWLAVLLGSSGKSIDRDKELEKRIKSGNRMGGKSIGGLVSNPTTGKV